VCIFAKSAYLGANDEHRDLIELTADKLMYLAQNMALLERNRKSEKEVKELLIGAVKRGALDLSQVRPKLLEALEI
jgi:hypothetical protein